MDKLDNLKKLKALFDDGIISEKEYSEMKNEILSKSSTETQSPQNSFDEPKNMVQTKKGKFTLGFKGSWSLFDAKTKIFINNELLFTESTKNGFEVSFPIQNSEIKVKLLVGGINSTVYNIEEIELHKNYKLTLNFDKTSGKYSNQFNIVENG
ncbi:SHOCT domain-containing protein [Flavobacterium sp.]|uniref:SHOCT domain-containing protein n=1 Tax=Flavobacterium sp. TaxID=239 RepID=UPI003753CC9D